MQSGASRKEEKDGIYPNSGRGDNCASNVVTCAFWPATVVLNRGRVFNSLGDLCKIAQAPGRKAGLSFGLEAYLVSHLDFIFCDKAGSNLKKLAKRHLAISVLNLALVINRCFDLF
jgi:hypothetical protein